ncbi:hypothetical protein [Frankia sp. AgW1.1]|uniref:hypothetical protein n=1 Tax=Frankia sp. AgW1.1 TaxID=1836971 RepID=UPI001931659F|nr:hypothetical protein [Frankia sp. AgW1.1]MBL7494382.1 hypothetical protein [Frankia sp. AgW1.1]
MAAQIDIDPFPAAAYWPMTDAILADLFTEWGLTGGCALVELDATGDRVDWAEVDRLRAQVVELEMALAHRAVPMADEFSVETVPWDQLSDAIQERLRARAREIHADYLARGYIEVDTEDGKALQAPPFEKWLLDLLGVIFANEIRPVPVGIDTVSAAIQEVAALQGDSGLMRSAIREAIAVLGPEPCSCCCEGSRAEVAEALRVLHEGLGDG